MEGSSRTQASFRSDLSLILRVIFGIAAVAGGINGFRRRISQLCPGMATGAPLDWIPVLIVMMPTWVGVATGTATVAAGIPTISALGHGVLGGVTQLLMTYNVIMM